MVIHEDGRSCEQTQFSMGSTRLSIRINTVVQEYKHGRPRGYKRLFMMVNTVVDEDKHG